MTFDEVDGKVVDRVGTVGNGLSDAVRHEVTVEVTFFGFRVSPLRARPDTVLVKPVLFQCVRLSAEVVDLPLSSNAGRIAGVADGGSKRLELVPIQTGSAQARHIIMLQPPMPERILTGQ